MPDTGAPWNIPYVAGTDLVSDWPSDSLALANAIANGLDAAGGLVDVKYVSKTDTFSASTSAGASSAVTGLTIAHAVADAAHDVYLIAQVTGSSGIDATNGRYKSAVALTAAASQLEVGDAASNRIRVSASASTFTDVVPTTVTLVAKHTPGSTSSVTYGVDLINVSSGTQTVYLNRSVTDTDAGYVSRGASTLMLLEVKV